MPVALTRAIRFAPGAVLRFAPALGERLLAMLEGVQPDAAEALAAVQAARLTLEHLGEHACRALLTVGDEAPARWRGVRFEIDLRRSGEDGCALRIAWTDPADATRRSIERDGVTAMLGGRSDVFFAERSGPGNRMWLKLTYDAAQTAAEIRLFSDAFAARAPAVVRALLPGQLIVGALRVAS